MAKSTSQLKHKDFTFIHSQGGIAEYRLEKNGLQVLLYEDHSAPVVGFMVTYHVGSRNEGLGYTGATHLLEHLMFKGSKRFNKKKGGVIFDLLEDTGARMNATTWTDRTNYYEVIPLEYLEKVIAAEADRMRDAFIKEEDRRAEMTVVRNELERGENSPLEALDKLIWSTAYMAHPYHHSTIGWRSDIENVPIERLKQFYNDFYWPNNATVTVAGDFSSLYALDLIQKYFGVHSRSATSLPTMYTEEPEQEGPRRVTVRRVDNMQIVGIAHKIPAAKDPDTHALHVLASVLGEGKSSRLYKKLVDTNLCTSIAVLPFAFHDNSLLISYATLNPGIAHAKVEKAILEEYGKLVKNEIPEAELERVKTAIIAQEVHSRDGVYEVLSRINEAIAMGDWTFYVQYIQSIRKASVVSVKAAAADYLREDMSTTGYFEGTAPRK